MKVKIWSKNWALVTELYISSDIIPRVGETLVIEEEIDGTHEVLVHDVRYIIEGEALTPVLKCRVFATPEHRLQLLDGEGWILPTG